MIDLTEKIKMVLLKEKLSQKELALRTNQTRQNLSRKLKDNNFKFSEFEKLLKALGCSVDVTVILPNGERI